MDRFKNVNGIVYKLCSKCHQYKPMTTEYFGETKNVKCGFSSQCKQCMKADRDIKKLNFKDKIKKEYLVEGDKNFNRQDNKALGIAYKLGYRINKEGTEFTNIPEGYNKNITIKDKSFKCVRFYYNNKLYCCTIASLQAYQKFGDKFGNSKAIHLNGDRLDDSYDNISTFAYQRYLDSIAETKVCSVCGRELPIENFSLNGNTVDYQTHSTVCKECANKLWYPAREFLKKYKEEHNCIVCGESEACCLDFHHIDPSTKKFNLSQYINENLHPYKVILEELNKTCLLCTNCHRKLHNGKLNVNTRYLLEHKVNVDEELYKHTSEEISGLINLENNG